MQKEEEKEIQDKQERTRQTIFYLLPPQTHTHTNTWRLRNRQNNALFSVYLQAAYRNFWHLNIMLLFLNFLYVGQTESNEHKFFLN